MKYNFEVGLGKEGVEDPWSKGLQFIIDMFNEGIEEEADKDESMFDELRKHIFILQTWLE
jgi:hypothetical protein